MSCVMGSELTSREEYVVDFLDRSNSVLLFNDPNLLQNNLLDLGAAPLKASKVQTYRSTIKNFILVFSQMHHLLEYIQMNQSLSKSLPSYEKMESILTDQMRTVYQAIIQNKTIPTRSKIDLFFHLRWHCLRIYDNFKQIELMKGRFSKEELDFLKSGKTSRQFIRYPASYSKHRTTKGPLSRLDKMLDLLTWGRTLANQQSAREELRGFTSANRKNAKKQQEVKAFAANDVKLTCSIVKKS
ncbi:MAG: hypothetical protein KF898_00815 [Parachlamydiales bacterium]|nr:hypothetical protein [Candidatus Acheromyda pituitae]